MPDQQLNAPVASGGPSDHAEHLRKLHEYALYGLGHVITGTLARAMSRRCDPQAKLH